jgi:hypothetical protein
MAVNAWDLGDWGDFVSFLDWRGECFSIGLDLLDFTSLPETYEKSPLGCFNSGCSMQLPICVRRHQRNVVVVHLFADV